jgi:hypothetical protein
VGFSFALVRLGPGDLQALPLRPPRCDRFRRPGKSSGPPPFAPSLNVHGDDAHNNSGFSVIDALINDYLAEHAGCGVPKLHGVVAAGKHEPAVRRERDRVGGVILVERAAKLAADGVPQFEAVGAPEAI